VDPTHELVARRLYECERQHRKQGQHRSYFLAPARCWTGTQRLHSPHPGMRKKKKNKEVYFKATGPETAYSYR
jgi:hypothetical protein